MKRFLLSTPAGIGVAAIAAAVHWMLPEHWVEYSRRSTLGSRYGAEFSAITASQAH